MGCTQRDKSSFLDLSLFLFFRFTLLKRAIFYQNSAYKSAVMSSTPKAATLNVLSVAKSCLLSTLALDFPNRKSSLPQA